MYLRWYRLVMSVGEHSPAREVGRGRGRMLSLLSLAVLLAVAGSVLALVGRRGKNTPAGAVSWVRHPALPFAITATEVTVAQFRACVQAGACKPDTVDPVCNYGQKGRDDHPLNCVNYFGAEQFCAFAGGRMCTEQEWLSACRGTEGRAFPYGDTFVAAACNVHPNNSRSRSRQWSTVPAASLVTCQGGLAGLFDMAGNVAEWVADCHGSYCKFRGAGFLSNQPVERFAACRGVCSGNQKTLKSSVVGIRCCRDELSTP
ncbi:MAG: hypothetical protein DRI34_11945 [Deltaproteobacteria bacterium]|nr:MAG: hypothetical protein DRI34_11945 [Deltaproteobacteria bacterium]